MSNAFRISGEQDVLQLATKTGTQSVTFTGWVKLSADRNTYSAIFTIEEGVGHSTAYNELITDGDGTTLVVYDTNDICGTVGTLTQGTWHKVAWVVSNGTFSAYFGTQGTTGVTQTVTNSSIANVSTVNYNGVGSSYYASSEWFNGCLSNVRVWNTELTKAEIEAEFTSDTPVKTENLLGAWLPSTVTVNTVLTAQAGANLLDGSGGGTPDYTIEDGPTLDPAATPDPITVTISEATQKQTDEIYVGQVPITITISETTQKQSDEIAATLSTPVASSKAAQFNQNSGVCSTSVPLTNFAICRWVKFTSLSENYYKAPFQWRGSAASVTDYINGSGNYSPEGTALPSNVLDIPMSNDTWIFIAYVWNGTAFTIYTAHEGDTSLTTHTTATAASNPSSWTSFQPVLGMRYYGGAGDCALNMQLAHVRIFTRASGVYTTDEIFSEAMSNTPVMTSGVLCAFEFDNKLTDSGPSGLTLANNGLALPSTYVDGPTLSSGTATPDPVTVTISESTQKQTDEINVALSYQTLTATISETTQKQSDVIVSIVTNPIITATLSETTQKQTDTISTSISYQAITAIISESTQKQTDAIIVGSSELAMYTYQLDELPFKRFDVNRFKADIAYSSITSNMTSVSIVNGTITLLFDNQLSKKEEKILRQFMMNHTGKSLFGDQTPLIDQTIQNIVNNFTATNLQSASVIKFGCTADSTLTGIDSTVFSDGRSKLIINDSEFTLTIQNNSALSNAENCFITSDDADVELSPGCAAIVWYDEKLTKIRIWDIC